MQLKRVNPKALLYHYFERSPTEFAIYDDELDMPIAYGSKNLVDSVVRRLNKVITIIYYKRDNADKVSYKRYAVFDGKKESTDQKKG